jgi:hypothetical protein
MTPAEEGDEDEAAGRCAELPGWDETMRTFLDKLPLEERLAGLTPEECLAGLTLEERLGGLTLEEYFAALTPEQLVMVMPLDALRALPEAYLRTLPAEAQARIRERLQGAAR